MKRWETALSLVLGLALISAAHAQQVGNNAQQMQIIEPIEDEGGGGGGGGGPTPSPSPAPPTGLVVIATTTSSVTIQCTAPAVSGTHGTPTSYDLRYGTTNPSGNPSAWYDGATMDLGEPIPSPGQVQSWTVGALASSTTYYFIVKANYSLGGTSGVSNTASGTTSLDVTAPSAVVVIVASVEPDRCTLMWTAVGDDPSGPESTLPCASYDVRISGSPIPDDAAFLAAQQVPGVGTPLAPGNMESKTLVGLAENTVYYLSVKVFDDAGNPSPMSVPVSFLTPENDHISAAAGDVPCVKSASGATSGMLLAALAAAALLMLRRSI